MDDIVQRRRARERIENDPVARARYDEMLAIISELTGVTGGETEIAVSALTLALDLEPPQPLRLRKHDPHQRLEEREDGRPDVMWATVSFPLATDDFLRRKEEVELIFAVDETCRWMSGGITPPELAELGLNHAWDIISEWVDTQRAGGISLVADSAAVKPTPEVPVARQPKSPEKRAKSAARQIARLAPLVAKQVGMEIVDVEARVASMMLPEGKIGRSEYAKRYLLAKVILDHASDVGAFDDVDGGDDLWWLEFAKIDLEDAVNEDVC